MKPLFFHEASRVSVGFRPALLNVADLCTGLDGGKGLRPGTSSAQDIWMVWMERFSNSFLTVFPWLSMVFYVFSMVLWFFYDVLWFSTGFLLGLLLKSRKWVLFSKEKQQRFFLFPQLLTSASRNWKVKYPAAAFGLLENFDVLHVLLDVPGPLLPNSPSSTFKGRQAQKGPFWKFLQKCICFAGLGVKSSGKTFTSKSLDHQKNHFLAALLAYVLDHQELVA